MSKGLWRRRGEYLERLVSISSKRAVCNACIWAGTTTSQAPGRRVESCLLIRRLVGRDTLRSLQGRAVPLLSAIFLAIRAQKHLSAGCGGLEFIFRSTTFSPHSQKPWLASLSQRLGRRTASENSGLSIVTGDTNAQQIDAVVKRERQVYCFADFENTIEALARMVSWSGC